MWIDVHPTRNHGPYFESTLNWLWYSSKICIHIYKLNICICIFLYIIFIYTREIRRTFLLYKVLIGWLECLRNNCEAKNFEALSFFFSSWKKQKRTNETDKPRRLHEGVFGTKDCMIFLLFTKKAGVGGLGKRKWKLIREKRCLSPIDFFLDTYHDEKSSTAAHDVSGGSSVQASAERDPCPLPDLTPATFTPEPLPQPSIPLSHLSCHCPRDNMHGNLRFYYVQQPCLDYVLFLGVFWSDIVLFIGHQLWPRQVSVRGPREGWEVRGELDRRVPSQSRLKLVFLFLFSCYF